MDNKDLAWWEFSLILLLVTAFIMGLIGIGYGIGRDAGRKEIINSEKWIVDFEKSNRQYDYRIYFHVNDKVYVGYGNIG